MNASRTNLLSVTRVLLTFGFWVTLLAMVGAAVALAMGYMVQPDPGSLPTLTPEQQLLAARANRGLQLLGGVMALPVLWLLRAIVDSARRGDPFIPENAARLRRIGWLMLALDIVVIVVSLTLPWSVRNQPTGYPGLVSILLIFVLARIFDTGARMRSEIQETI